MKYPCTHQLTEVTWPIPMLPSHQFKPSANKMKMKKGKITTSPADPINPYFETQSLIKDHVDIPCYRTSERRKQHVGLNIRRRCKPLIIK